MPPGDPDVPREPTTSAHLRTRRDHASETAEDYVEAIADLIDERGACRVTDLSERFGVSHVTVVRIVQRLEREGLVETEPYKPIALTAKGRRLARDCKRRHEIVYRFLLAIGVDERVAAIDSEGIEHHVSPQTLERLRAIAERGGA
jgi:DtxR family manganese transport transcriptional regulator